MGTVSKGNVTVVLFRQRTSLLITSILLGLMAVPSIAAQSNANSASPKRLMSAIKNPDVNPSDLAPAYPASAPPPRVDPLPDEREMQERSLETDYRVSNLLGDVAGNLWVGSWRGLSRIDPKTGKILARVSLPNIAIGALAQDKVGRLWVGSYEGLMRVEPRTNEITAQNLFLPSKRVLSLLLDKRGYLWAGTDNGLALISPDQGLIMTTLKICLV